MRQPPTINGKPPGEELKCLRWYQFTLADLIVFVTAVPLWIGVVAAVEFIAWGQFYEWFGSHWCGDVRHFLCGRVGLSAGFVCGYVTFAMNDLPAWVCYAVIAVVLGLLRWRWALPMGVAFLVSVFLWDFMSDYFGGLHRLVNLRLVSLFGVAVAASCFAIARRVRGRSHVSARKRGPVAVGLICLGVVAFLGVSSYGWRLIDLNRKTGLEVQKMFRSANPQ